jgi:hypothetical protein
MLLETLMSDPDSVQKALHQLLLLLLLLRQQKPVILDALTLASAGVGGFAPLETLTNHG